MDAMHSRHPHMSRRRFCQLAGMPAGLAIATLAAPTRSASPLQIQPVQPTGLAYAQASLVTGAQRLLFISGQVPAHADGTVPAAYPDQYRLAWRNVETLRRLAYVVEGRTGRR